MNLFKKLEHYYLSNVKKINKNKLREVLITSPEVSLKIETKKQFLENLEKPLYKNILKEGVVLSGEIDFFETIKIKRRFIDETKYL